MAAQEDEGGFETLALLKSIDPPLWLAPSQDLSHKSRTASRHLFSRLNPFCPKSPFDRLLVDGFDAEQIWQQIDLQSQPLLSGLRREVRRLEKNPREISEGFGEERRELERETEGLERENVELGLEGEGDDGEEYEDMEGLDEDIDDESDDEDDGGEKEEDEEEEEGGGDDGGIEDKFLRIKELEEYLEEGEAKEYGLNKKKSGKKIPNEQKDSDEEDEEGDEDEDDDEDNDDDLGLYGEDAGNENEGSDNLGNARYDDFFGSKKKKDLKRNFKSSYGSDDLGTDEKPADDKKKEGLSTHEKELEKIQAKIEQMEKETLAPKDWTMQGEVTAAKRPKNSALEVDLDFEHNVRPPPVITEEVTISLEDLIRGRIAEGRFDDVQKASKLSSKAPKEVKELDENKSKKGLAEVYEEEYVQTTGLASGPPSFLDEQKKEASMLFKKLCLKLDALSHFHFTPKPVIEDMSVQANVPALAIEEIAPMMVSDAAMLAPEEVFAGKGGDIKEETELTKADRKRRRASKKRKFKKLGGN